ncbi:membrane protein [Klebsiella pneumoniae]|uniref:Membrane protein n=1 Tax=Klebsiella pneumoniae TaxID=573 RepID=A0A2X3EYC5_KLEPN|nr:membrane protein [Klebsiella pneumoniae]
MIAGVILGGVCFGIAAGIVGWDMTLDYAQA